MREIEFDEAFMFAYSLREKTPAHRKYEDNVPEHEKQRR
jgi:tRNA A37 methylthiotransferase MiaB